MLQGRFAAAEDPLRQAIALVPERPAQQLMLAQCLEQLGRRDEAIAAYRAEAAVESQFKQAAIERLSQLSPAKR
jgi:predicted Zn-dependent protease